MFGFCCLVFVLRYNIFCFLCYLMAVLLRKTRSIGLVKCALSHVQKVDRDAYWNSFIFENGSSDPECLNMWKHLKVLVICQIA